MGSLPVGFRVILAKQVDTGEQEFHSQNHRKAEEQTTQPAGGDCTRVGKLDIPYILTQERDAARRHLPTSWLVNSQAVSSSSHKKSHLIEGISRASDCWCTQGQKNRPIPSTLTAVSLGEEGARREEEERKLLKGNRMDCTLEEERE
ncbi:unnamed protein product [Caretta caretta]